MPFYEYECSACKFYVEALQKISEPPMKKCPSCGKETLQRLISAPVFRLKGAGWYETDFKSDKENKRNLVDTGADDKEPTATDSDDKKIKVRASKALAKVAGKKAAAKTGKKPAGKSTKRPVKKAVVKSAKKLPAKKGPAQKANKQRPKKRPVAKAAKKAASKKAARKK